MDGMLSGYSGHYINAGKQMLTIIIDIDEENGGKHDNFSSH